MSEGVHLGLVQAEQIIREATAKATPNGMLYASYGETELEPRELERLVQTVPSTIAGALLRTTFYFVPLAMSERRSDHPGHRSLNEGTLVAPVSTSEYAEQAICHRNVSLGELEAVFLSTRLLGDRFALSFELFINVGHAFVETAGVPVSFAELAWKQAVAETRGESSQDAWESRAAALLAGKSGPVDEKAKAAFLEAAFSDAIAIYMLSLAVDFDFTELREREYPLLAPQALAERLRHVAKLFPPNAGYEFAIRYRRRA